MKSEPVEKVSDAQPISSHKLDERLQAALAAIGSWRDREDDEFKALDQIRHANAPTPPLEFDI